MKVSPEVAAPFIEALELAVPVAPRIRILTADSTDNKGGGPRGTDSGINGGFIPQADKDQATVVGSNIIGFAQGVSAEDRTSIAQSSLLAQLATNKSVGKLQTPTDLGKWYDNYLKVVGNTGWVLQGQNVETYTSGAIDVEVNEAIEAVAEAFLGPGATTLVLLKATLGALQKVSNGPWLTLYSNSSQQATMACFSTTLASVDPNANLVVKCMGFGLTKYDKTTQVLFFKWRSQKAELTDLQATFSIDRATSAAVKDAVAAKIAAYESDYIKSITL